MRFGWVLAIVVLSGCSVIVDGALEDEGDGGGTPCGGDAECDDGNECTADTCEGGTCNNAPAVPGTPCDEADMATAKICLMGACVDSVCGDGFVDTMVQGEQCDDGNEVFNDGCEPEGSERACLLSCINDSHCMDGFPCNGRETCDTASNQCITGDLPPLNTVCAAPGPAAGTCNNDIVSCCDNVDRTNCCTVVEGVNECPAPPRT